MALPQRLSDDDCKTSVNMLVIEDDQDDFYLLTSNLNRSQKDEFAIEHVTSLNEACIRLKRANNFDAIILDLDLPDSFGLNTVNKIMRYVGETPIIVLTGHDTDWIGEEAIRLGVEDYIGKDHICSAYLHRTICFAIERHSLLVQVKHQAEFDGLTKLLNRRTLTDKLEVLLGQANRQHIDLAMVLFDLDDFKYVNDNYGHMAGDDLLVQVAKKLNDDMRQTDLGARYGGDEFVIVLTNYDDLHSLVARKHTLLSGRYTLSCPSGDVDFDLGLSMGVATWEQNLSVTSLITRADEAMYASKSKGKNQLSFYGQ